MFAGEFAAFIEEFVEFVYVVAGVRQVGQPVERLLVAGVGELAQRIVVGLTYLWRGGVVRHILSVRPSSNWKVKRKEPMLTIGQLARHTGVPAKTVRFYHSIGLLPEPARDASGYRRYSATEAIALLKVRALAGAGIPLAQIPALLTANREDRAAAIKGIDRDLEQRITRLQDTRHRLNTFADEAPLPPGVAPYLELLTRIGLSAEWVQMEHDLWILAFATDSEAAQALLADQHQAKALPQVQQVYREYDQARDLHPDDPRLASLAERIGELARDRYGDQPPPAPPANSPVPELIQDMINSASPAWRRLDRYLRDGPANPIRPRHIQLEATAN